MNETETAPSVEFDPTPLLAYMEREQRTQRWICQQAGLAEPTLSKLLNFGGLPRIETTIALARVIGCNPFDFYVTSGFPQRAQ